MTMTKEERLIGISVIIDYPDWTPFEVTILGTMRQAIVNELETEWLLVNQQYDRLVQAMWSKLSSNDELAAHVAAVIDMHRANNA